jgi:error-prone DNA polymerase
MRSLKGSNKCSSPLATEMMSFIELHTRSAFSFLSSGSLPEEYAAGAAEYGMPAVALIDRDTVSGVVRFHTAAKEAGVKPIVGAEITMDDGTLLPLIPLNLNGYQNLCRLITTVKLRDKKGEHSATRKDIEEHSQGLLCFTGGADGFLHKQIKEHRGQEALAWLNYVFDRRLYVELQRHHLPHEEDINQSLLGLSHKFRIPYFASNGAYYALKRDRELFDVFTCIKNHCTIEEAGKLIAENSERYLKTHAQMLGLFEDCPHAVGRTLEIADRIDFSMDEIGYTFPDFPVPAGETMDSFLRKQAETGAIWRYGALSDKVRAKLDHELNLIEKLELAGYFLMVWEISQFCREKNILSQGRGSAANSVVCYALGITAVDPIAADLLFERFLSEERTEYPDIDIDLPSGDDREEVIQHVYRKYGERGAGMTANVITYRGRSAAREVGKVFGFDEEEVGRLAQLMPHYGTHTEEELIKQFTEAGFDPTDNYRFAKYMEMYARVLDFPRHLGQHSGGMVVSWKRLDGVVPLEPASMEGRTVIQWDKDDCEQLGIVKVDLLGLGMMAAIRDTITLIREHRGEEVELGNIPNDDPEVYKTLQNADTIGMFQVESRAQIQFLPRSKPEKFYDLVVQVAIIRPGPIVGKMLSGYIARRQGKEPIDYIHPDFKPILERTLGVPLFQEQLLRMAMTIAGFSGGEAEELRRALGFKRADKRLANIEKRLRQGMTERNIDAAIQDKVTANIMAFANYGFPESHAASFALLTYASAWLKVHYLAEFTAAMLNNYPLGFYAPATLVKDAQRHGLHFRPVDINLSRYPFTVEDGDVRVGLKYVKGLREEVAEAIVAERGSEFQVSGFKFQVQNMLSSGQDRPHAHHQLGSTSCKAAAEFSPRCSEAEPGLQADTTFEPAERATEFRPYTSVDDLVARVPQINRKEVRALSLAGALNFDNSHRRQALWESELAIQPRGELFKRIKDEGERIKERSELHPSSFNSHPFIRPMTEWQRMETDLITTGITIGKHPMAFLREDLKKAGIISAEETFKLDPRDIVSVAGSVIVRQRPSTAKDVVFMTMEDETGYSNFLILPDVFDRFRSIIVGSNFLVVRGIHEQRGMIKALFFQPINAFISKIASHDFQ